MQKPSVVELFFALVQCGIGKREKLPCAPSPEEWEEIFDIAQKQTMAGITFAAVEKPEFFKAHALNFKLCPTFTLKHILIYFVNINTALYCLGGNFMRFFGGV